MDTEGPQSVISLSMFLHYLNAYLRLAVYINKGTEEKNDEYLYSCIRYYNKFIQLEYSNKELPKKDCVMVAKAVRRVNLLFKVDSENNPVNLEDKYAKKQPMSFSAIDFMYNDSIIGALEYIHTHNPELLTKVPLAFTLPQKHEFTKLLWEHLRVIFYMSQVLLSAPGYDANGTVDLSLKNIQASIESIAQIEKLLKVEKILGSDKFLRSNLDDPVIETSEEVSEAKEEAMKIFKEKGLDKNPLIGKILDTVTSELYSGKISQGNMVQNMMGIASRVAGELSKENDISSLQESMGSIGEIFKDFLKDDRLDKANLPPALRSMIANVTMMIDKSTPGNLNNSEESLRDICEKYIVDNSLNREEVLQEISDENGNIDLVKFEQFVMTQIKDGLGSDLA